MSVEPAPHSLPKLPNNGDDGWTDDNIAELEKELELALVEQVNSSSASAPSSPRPRSVDAPQDEIRGREGTETIGSRPEELRDASRHGTPAQGREEWEQQETQVVVETLGKMELREEALVGEGGGVDGRDSPKDKEATETLQYDFWVNENDMRMSMLWPACERCSQDLVPQVETDVRVHHML